MISKGPSRPASLHEEDIEVGHLTELERKNNMLRQTYMGWSATSSALEEIIEYVEELANLTRVLSGVTNFRYGFLSQSLNTEDEETDSENALDRNERGKQQELSAPVSSADGRTKSVSASEFDDTVADLNRPPATLRQRKFSAFDGILDTTATSDAGYDITRTLSQIEQDYAITPANERRGSFLFARSNSTSTASDEELPLSLQRIVTGRYRTGRKKKIFS